MSESYRDLEARLRRRSERALRDIRRREQQASEQGTANRMYAAARPSRLTADWVAGTGSADSEIRSSLTNLRARGRALGRDSAYGKRGKTIVVNNVIGAGIGMQSQVKNARRRLIRKVNDAIEEGFREWMRAQTCHTGGELHFSDLERNAMGQVFEAGEVFVRRHRRAFGGSEVPYALELIESERVPHGVQPPALADARGMVRMGVEVDRYYRPVRYWIRDTHPSDIAFTGDASSIEVRPIPASDIIHMRIIERWPQTRGVPWMHAVATKVNDMSGYSEAEIIAARGASNYLAAVEQSDPMDPSVERQEDGSYEVAISPGIILRPRPNEKITFFAPNRPNAALDPFMRYMLREVAAGIGVSYESLSRDYSQSNYSSSRLSLLDDRDLWRVLQMWFIRTFRDIVHREWLQQAVLARAIPGISIDEYAANSKKFEAVKFKPRGWSWVDPTKEVAAFKEAIKGGLTTQTKVIAATGGGDDIEDVVDERAEELELARERGLVFDTDPAAQPTPPAQPDGQAAADDTDGPTDEDMNDEADRRPMRAVK
jgi:lambda family phage portal protein